MTGSAHSLEELRSWTLHTETYQGDSQGGVQKRDDGKRSEDSQSSGVERCIVPAAAKAFFCFFSLGGRSGSINRVADLWFMKQNNTKMELPRAQN